MKGLIFVPGSLLKEAFYRADGKVRMNIYICLWYGPCLGILSILIKITFMLASFSEIVWQVIFAIFVSWFVIQFVKNVRGIPMGVLFIFSEESLFRFVQILPFIYIFLGIYGCFKLVAGKTSIETFFSISCAIIGVWGLKYVLHLRRLAKGSNLPFNHSNRE